MKVEVIRKILERASTIHQKSGATTTAMSLLGLAAVLREHDDKSVATFVKAHKRRANRGRTKGASS